MTLALVALASWLAMAIASATAAIFWPVAIGALLLVLGLVLPKSRSLLVLLLGSALLLCGLSFWLQSELLKPAWIIEYADAGNTARVQLEVLSRPKQIYRDFSGSAVYGFQVRLQSIAGEAKSARGYLTTTEGSLSRGELIELSGKFAAAGKNARDSFSIFAKSDIERIAEAPIGLRFFNELRSDYVSKLSGITPDSAALVAGLAIGEIATLSADLEKRMREVSLTHLVAVSGSNCAIVIGLVYLLAVRLGFGRYGRTVIALGGLLLYVLLVGPDPSVLRAAVMSASVILMLALGRKSFALNALALAVIVLLIADPWLAVDYGFGLSVLATAGILLLAPAIAKRLANRLPKLLALAIAVTVAAQLMCLPLLMQLQPGIPSYSVAANLLAAPAVAPVTVLGIIGVILTPISKELVSASSFLASLASYWIEAVAWFFSELPLVYLPWLSGASAAAVSIVAILAIAAALSAKPAPLRLLGLATATTIVVSSVAVPSFAQLFQSWPGANWQLVACDVGQGDALVIRSQGRVAVIDVGPDSEKIDDCLGKLGVSQIDLLVLSHFDFDHVGGLEGALRGRSVAVTIISGFKDERPATQSALELLDPDQVIIAKPNLSGLLGEFSWRVLAPSEKASETKDANDASVIMMFSSSDYQLLLLGDIGESGQQRIERKVLSQLIHQLPLVLKVSHHGSKDQSASFHQQIDAEIALISVGRENGYGHPTKDLLEMLEGFGAQLLRTDQLGSIALSLDGSSLSWVASGY